MQDDSIDAVRRRDPTQIFTRLDPVEEVPYSKLRLRRGSSLRLSTWVKQSKEKRGPSGPLHPSLSDGSPLRSEERSVRWIGYIDRIERDAIYGWAYDTADPHAAVVVEAVTSGGKTSFVLADLERRDVFDAGYGTGRYGFVIDLVPLLLKDETLVVRLAASGHQITTEPIQFEPMHALLSHDMPRSFGNAMTLMAARIRHAYDNNAIFGKRPL